MEEACLLHQCLLVQYVHHWRVSRLASRLIGGPAFLTNYAIAGISPAFYVLSIEFEKTQTQVTNLLLWPVFTLGLFNFFWVRMAG
jgi:hypothetical protein